MSQENISPELSPESPEIIENSEAVEASEEIVDPAEEVIDQLTDTENDANGEEMTQEEIQEMKKILKLKVDGQEIDEEIDWNDEESLKKKLQMAHVAQKRMQESAEFKNQVNEFFQLLQTDPTKALTEMGLNVDDLAKNHLETLVKEAEMSPEEKEKVEMQKELENLRKEAKEKEEIAKNAELERMKDQYAAEIEKDISGAIDAMSDLPKSPYVVKRVADALMLAMNNGYNDVTAKDVLPVVQKQIREEISQMFGAMPEEVLEGFVGKENFDRVRKRRVNKAKKNNIETATAIKPTGNVGETQESAKKQSIKDFFKNL
jgi:hypothetical protein